MNELNLKDLSSIDVKILSKEQLDELLDNLHLESGIKKHQLFELAILTGKTIIELKDRIFKDHGYGYFGKHIKIKHPLLSMATIKNYVMIAENEIELREKLGENKELKKAYEYLRNKNKKENLSEPEKKLIQMIDHNKIELDKRKVEQKEKTNLKKRIKDRYKKSKTVNEPDRSMGIILIQDDIGKLRAKLDELESIEKYLANS
jgi:hypothetical protein